MTLHEVAKQVYSLTNGRVNGENYTESELENVFKIWMKNPEHLKIKNRCAIVVSLPDGEWLATIDKTPFGYDYYIPDTRDQEQRISNALLS